MEVRAIENCRVEEGNVCKGRAVNGIKSCKEGSLRDSIGIFLIARPRKT